MLVEGISVRSNTRMIGVSINTVAKFLTDADEACAGYLDEAVQGVRLRFVGCDEIRSFVYDKERNVPRTKAALTMRMGMCRFTRLTNGFSNKVKKHMAKLSLYFVHYNFCRIHKTLRVTPAMDAGLSDTVHDT